MIRILVKYLQYTYASDQNSRTSLRKNMLILAPPQQPTKPEIYCDMMTSRHGLLFLHYNDVIMSTMASQITSLAIVYWTVHSGTDERKHPSSASLAFVRGIHRWPVNSPHKWPVTRKMFPFDDVIMWGELTYTRHCNGLPIKNVMNPRLKNRYATTTIWRKHIKLWNIIRYYWYNLIKITLSLFRTGFDRHASFCRPICHKSKDWTIQIRKLCL